MANANFKVFLEGWDAHSKGIGTTDNPYPNTDVRHLSHELWSAGWWAAFDNTSEERAREEFNRRYQKGTVIKTVM